MLQKERAELLKYKTVLLFTIIILLLTVALLLVRYLSVIKKYRRNTIYLKDQLKIAASDREYLFWKRRLACHYLRLLPFINRKRAEKIYSFFHKE